MNQHGYATRTRNWRQCTVACVGLFASLAIPPAHAQWTEFSRLGTTEAICKGGVSSSAELQSWFAAHQADVATMMSAAGMPGATDALMTNIANGNFRDVAVTQGQQFEWMGRRKNGIASVTNRVRYTGKAIQPAVAVEIESNCQVHEILIPLTCCNVALLNSVSAPPPAEPTLDVVPPDTCGAGTAQVTTSAISADVELTMMTPDGSEVAIRPGAVELDAPGDYKIRASAINACGTRSLRRKVASFAVQTCPVSKPVAVVPEVIPMPTPRNEDPAKDREALTKKTSALVPFVAGYIGAQSRTRDLCYCVKDLTEGLVGVRGGVLYPLDDRLSLFGQVGAALNTKDSAWHTIHTDVGLEYRIGNTGFVGGGVGIWDLNNSFYRDATIFVHGGLNTPWKFGDGSVQWFIEARKWLDEPFDEEKYHDDYSGLTGFRLILK